MKVKYDVMKKCVSGKVWMGKVVRYVLWNEWCVVRNVIDDVVKKVSMEN